MDCLVNMIRKWKEKRKTIRENKKLCKQYPFLIPWNRFTGKLITESMERYDWSWTELDSMPDGWRKAFGIQMCDEIRESLVEVNDLNRWRIVQMKEKYGRLLIYDNGAMVGCRVHDIERKYEALSEKTCVVCGKPATRITLGWICPYCDDCCPPVGYESIDEWFKEDRVNE